MNRLTIAAAIAAAACAITIPAAAALASGDTSSPRGPSPSTVVDDRSGPSRGSDDVTRAPSAVSTTSAAHRGGDNGRPVEPGDDRGTAIELSDDNGRHVEPGDDRGRHVEPGDDRGSDDGGHHRGHSG